jgi:hypothetical protein
VKTFFGYFDSFDLNFIPSLVGENSYKMQSPKGFSEKDIDGLFLKNAG